MHSSSPKNERAWRQRRGQRSDADTRSSKRSQSSRHDPTTADAQRSSGSCGPDWTVPGHRRHRTTRRAASDAGRWAQDLPLAVTQQLARLKPINLDRCRRSVDALSGLLRFDAEVLTEGIDLDWVPDPLERALAELGLSGGARTVEVATAGGTVLDVAHPDGPPGDPVWEGPVRVLEPNEVSRIAAELRSLGSVDFARASVTCAQLDLELVGVRAATYLAKGLLELTEFYGRAAAGGEAVATWWD